MSSPELDNSEETESHAGLGAENGPDGGNCFAFSPTQLNDLFNPKSLEAFCSLGGLYGLEFGLRTDLATGLQSDESVLSGRISLEDVKQVALAKTTTSQRPLLSNQSRLARGKTHGLPFHDRIRVFGRNVLPVTKRKGFGRLLWDAYNDRIILLLTAAAVVSLSLGIYEAASGQSQVDWIEGVAVCVAIFIVVSATAVNDWQKERQFVRLNKLKVDREVRVIRSNQSIMVHIHDLTVGDIVHLEPGDCAPADGVVVTSYGLRCDESMATGESDHVEKHTGFEAFDWIAAKSSAEDMDPFIISGSKILEGLGTYLVLSVGPNSTHGRIMAGLAVESDPTPLQVKLSRLAKWIGWFGLGAALLLFFVLLFRFLAQMPENDAPSTEKGQIFMDILIVAVTVIVVAIPEGLPLAVTLALAFATTRMLKEQNLVRQLRACETMGNATVICSDKTGTLTQNKMTTALGILGLVDAFTQPGTTASSVEQATFSFPGAIGRYPVAFRDLLIKSITANSTAFREEREGLMELVGNKTDIALLHLVQEHLGVHDISRERADIDTIQVYPFDSARKAMALVYRVNESRCRVLVKGAAEVVLRECTTVITPGSSTHEDISTQQISGTDFEMLGGAIRKYASASLRTIGLAYRDIPIELVAGDHGQEKASLGFEELFRDMTWIGLFGIHDPLRPEVTDAIQQCHLAGVKVKMVTGDNLNTALAIAESCGIKTADGVAIEAPELRKLNETELDIIIPRLQVLARSSPSDKQLLVNRLKHLGEIVAVTGDGTNDGPALKSADVGFSMGLSGTEVAREASSIILMDDNFRSIVTAIAWGRCVNDAVAKFLQFQLTVNITAVCLTVVTAIYNSSNESVFKAVQLLWLNLIMDTFAALALATDPPTPEILQRPPTPRNASLFTVTMWKLMLGQSIYKLALCFTLYFAGDRILSLDMDDHNERLQLNTIIFNTFVWMQIFNEFNCRRLDNKLNVLEGVWKNQWFIVINILMVGGQILIVFVGGAAFGVVRLSGTQWAICLGCAVVCIPWAAVLKFIPDKYVAYVLRCSGWCLFAIFRPLKRVVQILGRAVRQTGFWSRMDRWHLGKHSTECRGDEETANGLHSTL
ncbi:cation-transporting atpase [Aspergillus eucalypticola CBS 122712]|uniref:Calcium-transporting ATPase n=1 Tax=Aspergillus eucalypticola (strain CBS 122712 / IBT 29274) TaxID=1448314 RepID=A0A317UL70_ASPEC|nr:cation-transporting atpase [Aspergillus eucalypticola CBS 122712]PWY62205.1 cation-transporting atpase [Aspergillus eucalypticola CBS 122712]